MNHLSIRQKLVMASKKTTISVLCLICALTQMMQATLIVAHAEELPSPNTSTSTPVESVTTPQPVASVSTVNESSQPQTGTVSDPTPPAEPVQTVQGPTSPTGSAAPTYVYNAQTGLWENGLFIWDPITHQTTPKQPQSYSYNPTTGAWETKEWSFDASTQSYVPHIVTANTPPTLSEKSVADAVAAQVAQNSGAQIAGGPGSTQTQTARQQVNATFDRFYDASISGTIRQDAVSGSAALLSNTTAGNVVTGQALSMASVINTLNSMWGGSGVPNVTTFLSNINGDVYGDLLVDPGAIKLQQDQLGVVNNSQGQGGSLTVNAKANGLIDNTIDVNATSGGISLDKNTAVGNADTGSAHAVANVVDVINSTIAAGQSFLGTVNIWGNLNGDILLPPGFLDQVLAGQQATAPTSNNATQAGSNTTVHQTNVVTQQISTQIEALARSGAITANSNTKVGDVTTGSGLTNVQVFNLTNKDITANDAMMVFVNVMGSWVGFIVDNPVGATYSLLGGGVTNNQAYAPVIPQGTVSDVSIQNQETNTIRNNVLASAKTGDIDAQNNTSLGNLTTGNATTTVNIFDIISSRMQLSRWFGVLFINVFGSWQGSFGVDTANGDAVAAPTTSTTNSTSSVMLPAPVKNTSRPSTPRAFVFRPMSKSDDGTGELIIVPPEKFTAVLANQSVVKPVSKVTTAEQPTTSNTSLRGALPVVFGSVLMFGLYRLMRRSF